MHLLLVHRSGSGLDTQISRTCSWPLLGAGPTFLCLILSQSNTSPALELRDLRSLNSSCVLVIPDRVRLTALPPPLLWSFFLERVSHLSQTIPVAALTKRLLSRGQHTLAAADCCVFHTQSSAGVRCVFLHCYSSWCKVCDPSIQAASPALSLCLLCVITSCSRRILSSLCPSHLGATVWVGYGYVCL